MQDPLLDILEKAHRDRCGSDRLFCYVATNAENSVSVWQLSFVEEDEPGHFPISHDVAVGTEEQMRAFANRLNRERLKMTPDQAAHIIASSMRSIHRQGVNYRR